MAGEGANQIRTVRVFGSTRAITADGVDVKLPPKSRNMLALLVAGGVDGLTTEQILDEVADGDRSAAAQSKVRMDLSRLRQRIGDDVLPPGQGRWQLLLPVEAVDHHALLQRSSIDDLGQPDVLRLFTGAPFRESAHTPLIQTAIKRAAAARGRLLAEILDARPDLLTPALLDALAELVEADPFDDTFASLVLQSHLLAGEQTRARTLLAGIELAFSTQLDGATPGIDASLRRQVLAQASQPSQRVAPRDVGAAPTDPFVGRADHVDALVHWASTEQGPSTAVVTGRAGIGKSRLLDEVVHRLTNAERTVVRVAGRETARSALEPWREGVPKLGPHLTRFLEAAEHSDLLIARARLWDAARAELVAMGRPLVVIDDAQWFDSLSLELAEFLLRTAGADLQILVAGRPPNPSDWGTLHDSAAQLAGATVELAGLTRPDLEELIGHLRPKSRLAIRSQFAAELEELSGGLPAIARPVIENAVGDGLHAPPTAPGGALVPLIERFDAPTREVALALAVLGLNARWEHLVELVEVSERELLDACSTLSRSGLTTVGSETDPMVNLSHVVVRDAILDLATDTDRWRLNRSAAALATTIHQRAEHEFLAYPLVDGKISGQSLLESAETHHASGALREAINAFQRARLRMGTTPLPIASLISWAGALDRLGLQGHRVRVEAVGRAIEAGDIGRALDAALSGLPEAETATGDPDRLELLMSIPHEELPQNRRFDHAHATGRQLAVLGNSDDAGEWLDLAGELAVTEDEADRHLLARWLADYAHVGHNDRVHETAFYPPEANLSIWAKHLQGIDRLGAGHVQLAIDSCTTVASDLDAEPNPYLRWHNLLLQATAALSDGRVHDATLGSNTAFEHGVRYGLREAGSAWLAQIFMSVWMQRGATELLEPMALAQGDVEGSFLAEAAFAVALQDGGEFDRATTVAGEVAERAIAHRSFAGVGALLLVSRVLRNEHPLSQPMHETLLPLSGSLAVVGGGFACIGPVDMALGLLAGEAPNGPHFTRAIALVDDLEVRGWQIALRLELARTFGDSARRREAASLSAGLGWDTQAD